jgi:hypothetical protein
VCQLRSRHPTNKQDEEVWRTAEDVDPVAGKRDVELEAVAVDVEVELVEAAREGRLVVGQLDRRQVNRDEHPRLGRNLEGRQAFDKTISRVATFEGAAQKSRTVSSWLTLALVVRVAIRWKSFSKVIAKPGSTSRGK